MRNARKTRNKRAIRKAAQKRRDNTSRQRANQRYAPPVAAVKPAKKRTVVRKPRAKVPA